MDHKKMGEDIVRLVGGEENINGQFLPVDSGDGGLGNGERMISFKHPITPFPEV